MQQISLPSSTDKETTFQTVRPADDAVIRAVRAAAQTDGCEPPWPWCFYLIGPQTAEGIAWMEARRVERIRGELAARDVFNRWCRVPGWIVITCQQREEEDQFEQNYALCRNALQNFVLSLGSEHIDTTWIGEGITEEQELYTLLEIDPADEYIVGILWYGYRDTGFSGSMSLCSERPEVQPIRYRP